MNYFFILSLFIGNLGNQTKTPEHFEDIIEVLDNGNLKIFLENNLQITYRDCAKYYLIAEFDESRFQLKNSIRIFYMNDKPYLLGHYQNGMRNGEFRTYYKNGSQMKSGNYRNGKPVGIWKYYFENGQLERLVEYKINGQPYLKELYKKNGKMLVENGKGEFQGLVSVSSYDGQPFKFKGDIENGLPEGEWKVYMNGKLTGIEFFKENIFIEGTSYSSIVGNSTYNEGPISSFIGINYIEKLNINKVNGCFNKSGFGYGKEFYNELRKVYAKSSIKEETKECWFLVLTKVNEQNEILDVSILSRSGMRFSDELRQMILSVGKTYSKVRPFSGNKYFPIVIQDSEIHFPVLEKKML